MKKLISFSVWLLAAGSLWAADASTKEEVKAAAVALGNQPSYSWHSTMTSHAGNGRFGGPTEGKTDQAGDIWLSMTRGSTTNEAILENDGKGAMKTDDGWESLANLAKDDGSGGFNPKAFLARMLQTYKAPASQATNLLAKVDTLAKTNDAYAGDLTDDGAKSLLTIPRRPGSTNNLPTVSNAKGSVTFWIKDGILAKYEFNLSGKIDFNGNGREIDRTTTVEIKDVGATKVMIPEEAKKAF